MEMRSKPSAYTGIIILLLLGIQGPVGCHAAEKFELTSSKYSVTLTFTPNPSATNYTASFVVKRGIFFTDVALEPPYDGSPLTVTYRDNVLPGHIYVVELYENETLASSKVFGSEIATVPLKPENVEVVARGMSFLSLQWEDALNGTYDGHEIGYMRENASWIVVNISSDVSFNLTDLDAGYNYQIYIVAVKAGIKSEWSQTLTTSTLPRPPINLNANALGTDQINITWESHPTSFQESFEVRFALSGSDVQKDTSCTQSPCLFTPGPPAGQVVTIFVYAVSHGFTSIASTIQHSTAPATVTNLQGVAGVRMVSLEWNAPANSIQVSYKLTYTNVLDGFSRDKTVTSTENMIKEDLTDLIGGYIYQVDIRAQSQFALGEPVTEIYRTLPESISNLSAVAINTTSVSVSWSSPVNSHISSINITVYKPDNDTLEIQEDVTTTTRIITGLIPGENYKVAIAIYSQYSPPSEEKIAMVRSKPIKPALVSVEAGETELNVTLVREEELGVFDNIQASLKEGSEVQMSDSLGLISFKNLEPGTQYTLDAYTLSGQEASASFLADIYTKPRPARNLYVTAMGEDSINVSWDDPDSGGYDNFTVTVEESEGITHPKIITTTELKLEFDNLQPGTTYNVTVVTNKGDQQSAEIRDQNTTTPLPVLHIRVAVRGIDTVTVAWDAPIGSALTGYALSFNSTDEDPLLLPANKTQYKFEGLEPESNYSMELFAYSQRPDGVLLYSPGTEFNFSTYPESVAALQKVEATTDSITVNWTVPTSVNVDYFQLGIKAVDAVSLATPKPVNVPVSRTNMTFSRLEPGFEYIVAIRTVKVGPRRNPSFGVSVRLNAVTKPLPVIDLQAETDNTTALTLNWATNSSSRQNRFLVTYTADGISKSIEMDATNTSSSYDMTLTQLLAGYTYSVKAVAIRSIETDTEYSDELSAIGYTVPLAVTNLTLTTDRADLRVSWNPPASGKWNSYKVNYRPTIRDSSASFLLRTTGQSQPNDRITDLFPGERYQIKVMSVSNELESASVEGFAIMQPLLPKDIQKVKGETTENSAMLSWTYDRSVTITETWNFQISTETGSVNTERVNATEEVDYTLPLSNLEPGRTYSVEVTSEVQNKISDVETVKVTAKPLMNSKLGPDSSTNNSLTMRYTVEASDIFDHFAFTLPGVTGSELIVKTKTERPLEVTFENLEPGTIYTIQAVTVSSGETSSPITLDMITDPVPIAVEFISTATTIKLSLGPQVGGSEQHVITCLAMDGNNSPCGEKTVMGLSGETIFDGLKPFQMYQFIVVTKAEVLRGEAKEAVKEYTWKTAEDAPSAVRSLSVSAQDLHSVTLTWQPPAVTNGILRSYTVSYQGTEPTDPQAQDLKILKDIPISTTSLPVSDLKAGFQYTFMVSAVTVSQGEIAEQSITMGTAAPAFKAGLTADTSKPEVPDAKDKAVTQNTISMVFTNPFSTENGYIRYYTVVVSKDPTVDDSAGTLPSWSDAKKDSSIKVYQALGQCEDFFTSGSSCGASSSGRKKRAVNDQESRTFVVGVETANDCKAKSFCNGPLSQNTEYYVKLRGFTASGEFQETAYSEKIKTAESKTSNGGLIGGVIVAVIVPIVIIIIIVFFVIRRRKRPKRATKHAGPKMSWEQSTMNKFSRPVRLSDFPAHVRKMAADSDLKYAEEYEDLKEVGRDQPCLAAEFPPNRPKNRFTNILPYDHSRVKLLPTDDEEGSDYINANYMPGYSSKREYIATQGPLPATRDDFWRMVWEQSTRNIVMLTRCQEKGREKSDHYWPSDPEPKFYGDLQVVILNETHMPDWTVTEFKVSLGMQSRNVRHFHYRVWPDFGVPKDPTSLIRFVRTVREKLIREGGPIITHCSAGVGRSGTFIVLDHVLQLIREKEEVDVFSIVYKLRKERVLMVQTEQQYKFIHECLVCVLEGREEDTTYANVGEVNVGFEDEVESSLNNDLEDDEGINVEVP